MPPEEARDILREAVRRGMDPAEAADLADMVGIGDKKKRLDGADGRIYTWGGRREKK